MVGLSRSGERGVGGRLELGARLIERNSVPTWPLRHRDSRGELPYRKDPCFLRIRRSASSRPRCLSHRPVWGYFNPRTIRRSLPGTGIVAGMKRKILISYKRARDDAPGAHSETIADALRCALTRSGYAVLIDKDIPGGASWQDVISQNLHDCEAAVALLSPAALDSPWVRHELSVLSNRAKSQPAPMVLLLAMVGTAEVAALDSPTFKAMGLGSIQAFRRAVAASIQPGKTEYRAEKELPELLTARLTEAFPADFTSPRRRLVAKLHRKLRGFPVEALSDLEATLALVAPPGDLDARWLDVANALLGIERERALLVVQDLRANGNGRKIEIKEIIELVFPFTWVHPEAAARLATAHATTAFPALNARRAWTLEQYLRRAEEDPKFWYAVKTGLPGSELANANLEEVAASIGALLYDEPERTDRFDGLTVEQKLEYIVQSGAPGRDVFFPIVSNANDAERLLALGQPWIRPILAGPEQSASPRCVPLRPPLTKDAEDEALSSQGRLFRTLERK